MEHIMTGAHKGLVWAANRAVRIGVVMVFVWVTNTILGVDGSDGESVRLMDATVKDLVTGFAAAVFALIVVWGILFHEDRE